MAPQTGSAVAVSLSAGPWIWAGRRRRMPRILVGDDEESIRTLRDTVLTRKRHEVILADGGHKGLELFHAKRPQLTILHLLMPDLTGIDVLQSIRAQDEQAQVI